MAITPDPIQPDPNDVEFAFGLQPEFTRNKDLGKKIGVVGTNDDFKKFIEPQLAQRGGDLYLCDLNAPRVDAARALVEKHGRKATIVGSAAEMPDGLHGIYVLTPPFTHLGVIKEIVESYEARGLAVPPIGLEKPFTGNRADMEELERFVKEHNVPVYGIDWTLLNGLPLFHAVGMNVPFPEALEISDPDNNLARFKLQNTTSVDARDIEGGGNSLGDPEAVARERGWMEIYEMGGGVHYDMNVHLANALAEMGLELVSVEKVFNGTLRNAEGKLVPADYPEGTYRQFGKEITDGTKTGEIYGFAHLKLRHPDGNREIDAVLECGKRGKYNDQYIRLTDDQGNVLHWEIIPTDAAGKRVMGSTLYMWNNAAPETTLATISMTTDCYALAVEQFDRFATQWHNGDRPPREPSHFHAQTQGVFWVDAMHQLVRSGEIFPADATVQQLRVREEAGELPLPVRRAGIAVFEKPASDAVPH